MADQDSLIARIMKIKAEGVMDDAIFRAYCELHQRGELSDALVRMIEGPSPILLRFSARSSGGGRQTKFDTIFAAAILARRRFNVTKKMTLGDTLSFAQVEISAADECKGERFCRDISHVHQKDVFDMAAFTSVAEESMGDLLLVQPTFRGSYTQLRDRLDAVGLRFASIHEYAGAGAPVTPIPVMVMGSPAVNDDGTWYAPIIRQRPKSKKKELSKGGFGTPDARWQLQHYSFPVVDK